MNKLNVNFKYRVPQIILLYASNSLAAVIKNFLIYKILVNIFFPLYSDYKHNIFVIIIPEGLNQYS